ncbi:hypothetical protein [Nonomuraea longicatena]|uniref:Uncharacterized protein n=1 Tax=Nonomuraea longicatena TaxID=83682 RepID=A0ABP3ZEE2_9ACTN
MIGPALLSLTATRTEILDLLDRPDSGWTCQGEPDETGLVTYLTVDRQWVQVPAVDGGTCEGDIELLREVVHRINAVALGLDPQRNSEDAVARLAHVVRLAQGLHQWPNMDLVIAAATGLPS